MIFPPPFIIISLFWSRTSHKAAYCTPGRICASMRHLLHVLFTWVLRQSFEGFVSPWLTDAKSMLLSSCRNRCSKDNSSTASFQLHLSCWKACLSESLAIFQGILVSPRKQTNYPYSPFFLKCFDHYGHNITTAATDVATWEAVPSQEKVVCILQLLSPWSLQEHGSCEKWQVARDLSAIPTFATKWSTSWSLSF